MCMNLAVSLTGQETWWLSKQCICGDNKGEERIKEILKKSTTYGQVIKVVLFISIYLIIHCALLKPLFPASFF